MLRFILYFVLFFMAVTMQTVVVPRILILNAQPSFLLILTVMIALRHGALAGCFSGFMAGLICDVYAPVDWLGAYSLSYCIVGFIAGQIEESFLNLNLLLKAALLAAMEVAKDLIYFLAIGKKGEDILQSIASISLPNTIYTVCIGAVFFYIASLFTENRTDIYRTGPI